MIKKNKGKKILLVEFSVEEKVAGFDVSMDEINSMDTL